MRLKRAARSCSARLSPRDAEGRARHGLVADAEAPRERGADGRALPCSSSSPTRHCPILGPCRRARRNRHRSLCRHAARRLRDRTVPAQPFRSWIRAHDESLRRVLRCGPRGFLRGVARRRRPGRRRLWGGDRQRVLHKSRFSLEPNTSKLGFSVLIWHLARWGYRLNDDVYHSRHGHPPDPAPGVARPARR